MRKKLMAEIEAQAACADIAKKLSKAQLSEKAIEMILLRIYLKGDRAGYERKAREIKAFKDKRLSSLDNEWKAVFAEIDDITHGGFRNKQD
jgi:hypothetical protein